MEEFALSDLVDSMIDLPDVYAPVQNTTTVNKGETVRFTSSIADQLYEFDFTFLGGNLYRLTKMVNESTNAVTGVRTGYNVITGVIRDVRCEITVYVDGEAYTQEEFYRHLVNAGSERKISVEDFHNKAAAAGFRWGGEDLSILFQHMGASESGIVKAFADFEAAGATRAIDTIAPERRKSIKDLWIHPTGVPVTSFEVSQADRSASRSGEHGFVDFLEAGFESFMRSMSLRLRSYYMTKSIEEAQAEGKLSAESLAEMNGEARKMRRESGRWITNLGGVQERITVHEDGTMTREGIWDATQVPCGRLTLQDPVMVPFKDPSTGEAMLDASNSPIMVQGQQPEIGPDRKVVMENGAPKLVDAYKVIPMDFWRSGGDDSDGPKLNETTVERDLTVPEPIVASVGATAAPATDEPAATTIPDEEPF